LLVVALDDEEALEEEPLACLVLILCRGGSVRGKRDG
jgi:hypothetical protein